MILKVVGSGSRSGLLWEVERILKEIVDGIKIKENTWYTLKNGEIVEVEE